MKFDENPSNPKSHDKKIEACIDCGAPVRHSVQRCRVCYLEAIARGRPPKTPKVPSILNMDDTEQCAYSKMDAAFCEAMKRAHPGRQTP